MADDNFAAGTELQEDLYVSDQYEKSIEVSMEALRHLPDEPSMYFNMANVYGKMAQFEKSEKYFLKALNIAPNSAKYYANLGKIVFLACCFVFMKRYCSFIFTLVLLYPPPPTS